MKNSILAVVAGAFLTIVVAGSIFLLPGIMNTINQDDQEPDRLTLGARIADYIDTKAGDVVYTWCYNNSFVNLDLSEHFDFFVDGVRIDSLSDGVVYVDGVTSDPLRLTNISLLHDNTEDRTRLNPIDLNSVIDEFEAALTPLDELSTSVTGFMEIFPPTFLYDIAYEDGNSTSIIYSQDYHVLAIINGTWDAMESYPVQIGFSYSTDFDDAAFFDLDGETEVAVTAAIQSFHDLITGAYE